MVSQITERLSDLHNDLPLNFCINLNVSQIISALYSLRPSDERATSMRSGDGPES